LEFAAGAAPGWVGDVLSTAVDKAVEGFKSEATAGSEGQRTLEDIQVHQNSDVNHLIVSAYQQAGALPADTPDLDAVTDDTGQVSALDSFRDDQIDPDVTGNDLSSLDALAQIARQGPAGGNPEEWKVALNDYSRAANRGHVDVDYANPEPRAPLDSTLIDKARRGDRYDDAIPWPIRCPSRPTPRHRSNEEGPDDAVSAATWTPLAGQSSSAPSWLRA
jgi:hypothetical protein